ncbi:FAS1 domain-containing protein [Golovinomyces cichoracearum]|uniref:FAS1 domain-containing protein n=1 Tax=Golovinomyces cichoracearum TaxID=62708 RepID=A0A420J0G4_9PEZI|nr:FAS1 domain-containing protein [Golovinomyces cichoracearum]
MHPILVILIYINSFADSIFITSPFSLTDIRIRFLSPAMEKSPSNSTSVLLSDVIGSSRSTNAFAGFTRSFASITRLLEADDSNITVLAPTNRAIMKLPQRPWEDPSEYSTLGEDAYEGKIGEDRALKNLETFVESHLMWVSPWKEGEMAKSMSGKEYCWHIKDGVKIIQPGNVEIIEVLNSVRNGELWLIDGVLN